MTRSSGHATRTGNHNTARWLMISTAQPHLARHVAPQTPQYKRCFTWMGFVEETVPHLGGCGRAALL
eukprot:3599312-Lingulodinium_polyedra.AAC.1